MELKDKLKFKKMFCNQVPSNFSEARNDRVSNLCSHKGRYGDSPSKKPTCTKCGKKHMGECLVGTDNYFGCGKNGHKVRNFPMVRGQVMLNIQDQARGPSSDAPKKNPFYPFCSRGCHIRGTPPRSNMAYFTSHRSYTSP